MIKIIFLSDATHFKNYWLTIVLLLMMNNMFQQNANNISRFFIAGINYKKTEASIRGLFSIGEQQYEAILSSATAKGVSEMFVLSTCNRTEIYGICNDTAQLIDLLCSQTPGTID